MEQGGEIIQERQFSFAEKKASYFARLALESRDALEMHKRDINGKEEYFWKKKGERAWRPATEHNFAAAARVDSLGMMLGLPESIQKDLRTAALLHDFNKPREVELTRAAIVKGKPVWNCYIQAGHEADEKMRVAGFSDSIIRYVNAVSHTELTEDERLAQSELLTPEDMATLAMAYIDWISKGNEWASPVEMTADGKTINQVDRRFMGNAANELYRKLDEEGKEHFFNHSGTWAELTRVAHVVEGRLTDLIEEHTGQTINPIDLPTIIDQAVKTRIRFGKIQNTVIQELDSNQFPPESPI